MKEGKTAYSEITFEYVSRENRWEESMDALFKQLFGGEGNIGSLMMLDKEGIGEFLELQQRLQDKLEEGKSVNLYESDLLLLDIFRFIQNRRNQEAPFRKILGKGDKAALLREMIRARFPGKLNWMKWPGSWDGRNPT